jgi:ACS family D-galactonate transporter-like MFS transporter
LTTRQTTQAAIIWLLASSIFINYIDRTNLAIAGPLVSSELHLTGSQFGLLSTAFFVTYALFQLVSGALADRMDVKWLLAGGFALWSIATGVAGLVHGYAALFVARLILGAGESVAYPSYSRILSYHFTEEQRGWPNAVISAGFSFGLASGLFFGGMLVGRIGWRPFFIGLCAISLLWLIPWLLVMPPTPARATADAAKCPTALEILAQREFLGTALGLFCANYFSYTLLTWLPRYLVEARHFTMDQMAVTGGVTYIVVALSSMGFGRLADARIRAGLSTPRIRKTISSSGLAISAVSLLIVAWTTEPALTVAFLIAGGLGFGIFSSNHWAATQTLAGPLASGRWTGMENFTGNLAGMIAPVMVGVVVDRTGQYFAAFALAAAITLIGAATWAFVIRDVREVSWRERGVG